MCNLLTLPHVSHEEAKERVYHDSSDRFVRKSKHREGYNTDWKEQYPWLLPVADRDAPEEICALLCEFCVWSHDLCSVNWGEPEWAPPSRLNGCAVYIYIWWYVCHSV